MWRDSVVGRPRTTPSLANGMVRVCQKWATTVVGRPSHGSRRRAPSPTIGKHAAQKIWRWVQTRWEGFLAVIERVIEASRAASEATPTKV